MAITDAIDLDLRPIGGALGAEVHGLDVNRLDANVAKALNEALIEHHVLFLPGLNPTVAQLRDIGAMYGELEVHPYLEKVDEDTPEVVVLDTSATPKADVWHTDATFSEHPPVAALLHMVECPPWGGDTMWLNSHLVYDSLSVAMQTFLEGLTCIHDDGGQGKAKAEHPVIRVHPVTGRKSLYVHKQFSRRIPQLSRPESQNLLSYLFKWSEQIKFTCRWHWSAGDVALWDERVTLHAMVDDTTERRLLRRVTVLGDDPRAPEGATVFPRVKNAHAASSDFYGVGSYEF